MIQQSISDNCSIFLNVSDTKFNGANYEYDVTIILLSLPEILQMGPTVLFFASFARCCIIDIL